MTIISNSLGITRLPPAADEIAPDGTEVRLLCRAGAGSMAHFQLPPRATSHAVMHPILEEIWYFLEGNGEFWRRSGDTESIDAVCPGTSVSLLAGTYFQLRCTGDIPLAAVAVTMPPWTSPDDAQLVDGPWIPTV